MGEFNVGDKVVYRKTLVCTIISKNSTLTLVSYGLSVDDTNNVAFIASDNELEAYAHKAEPTQRKHGWVTLGDYKRS